MEYGISSDGLPTVWVSEQKDLYQARKESEARSRASKKYSTYLGTAAVHTVVLKSRDLGEKAKDLGSKLHPVRTANVSRTAPTATMQK
ncbi:hypothetical protein EYC84_004406 [Monilinia fructicola]|uniref:Uncharacterized protein n=1 Tax=Monilinia fructicola TaxID=38448 RepID=A0A5M9K2S1_MONFR|nr:hypothetical protein EYC84_004406 [Monilinia fructicola]